MAKRASLKDLHRQIREVPRTRSTGTDPNPQGVGERADFVSKTIRLPEEQITALQALGRKRRREGKPNRTVSALIREALAELLEREA